MNEKWKKLILRVICVLLVGTIGASSYHVSAVSRETQEKIDQLKKEKSEAEQDKKEAEQEKGYLSNQKSEMEERLKELEKQASSLNEQIALLEEEVAKKEAEIEQKKEEVQAAQEEVSRQYEDMKKRIQYTYENGQGAMLGYMAAALTDGLTDMLNRAEYAMNISQYDRNMLESYRETKASLEQQEAELQEQQEELALLVEETKKKKEQVASQQKATGSKISQFDELLGEISGEVSSMEELIAEKTKILNQLIKKAEEEERQARIAAAQQAASSMNGGAITAGDSQISKGSIGLSDYELMLLATMIYCEAGNQGWEGQTAVGYVIMNRVRSALYPNSLEAVLRQSRQFEPAGSGRFDLVLKAEQDPDIPNIVTQSCWDAARAVVNGTSNVGDSLFFRTWAPVPTLVENLKNGGVPYWIIRDHIFYYYWTSYSSSPKPSQEPEEEPDDEEEPEEEKPKEPEKPDDPQGTEEPEKPDDSQEPEEGQNPGTSENPDNTGGDAASTPPQDLQEEDSSGMNEGMRE